MENDPLDDHENLLDTIKSARVTACQFSRKFGLRREEEADLMGELLLRIVEKRHLYDPEKSNFRTWLSRVLPNAARNFGDYRMASKRDDRMTVMLPSS